MQRSALCLPVHYSIASASTLRRSHVGLNVLGIPSSQSFPVSLKELCMKKFVACLAVVVLSSSAVIAAELKSGLDVGEAPNAFYVQDVTGPSAGKDPLCYRCQYGKRPVVAIFTRKVDDKVASLVKQIDSKVAKS